MLTSEEHIEPIATWSKSGDRRHDWGPWKPVEGKDVYIRHCIGHCDAVQRGERASGA